MAAATADVDIPALARKVTMWTGLEPSVAFSIDDAHLFQKLGLQFFIDLVTDFYNRVYADEEEWFRSMFKNPKEVSIENLYEYLVQKFGGPPLYSNKRGPVVMGKHDKLNIPKKGAERWLLHMGLSLDGNPNIDSHSRTLLKNFFTFTAYFIVARTLKEPENEEEAKIPNKSTDDLKPDDDQAAAVQDKKEVTGPSNDDLSSKDQQAVCDKEEDNNKPTEDMKHDKQAILDKEENSTKPAEGQKFED